jgi:hypothetical protein
MPTQTSNQTALRASGFKRRVYVSDMSGDVVLNASVTATPTFPAWNVAISVNSGSAASVQRGMRVVVETSGGDYKGTLHIRAAGTISSTNLPLREFSKGFVQVASGDVLKVYDDPPIFDKLVADDATFAPDRETYAAQFSDPRPLACSGGWYAGWASRSSAVPLVGSDSLNLDPDTANTLTHAWEASGGTIASASAADTTIDLSTAGKYRVGHTVTAANSASRKQNVRMRTHDDNDPPYIGTEEAPMAGDFDNGFSYSFRLYGDTSGLRDYAPVVVWVDETINGTIQSFGAKVSGRSHIKCSGYLRRDRSGWDADERRSYVIFEVISPLAALAELPGFSKVMTADASPANWSEIKTLTIRRALVYLLLYYTNFNEAGHDLLFDDDGMTTKLYSQLFIEKLDPLGQLRELADGADCRVTCDRLGRLEIQRRPELTPLADRGDIATTLSLTTADLIDYEMEREHKEIVEMVRTRGFTAGATTAANQPLFARWPGRAPGYGNQNTTFEKLICDDAADHYDRCAMRGAWANKTFTDANGVKRIAPKMRVRLPGSYDVFDLYREWVGVSFSGNLRGVDPSDFRWLVESISTTTEGGNAEVVLTLQAETYGIVDHTEADDTPATGEDNGLPPWKPPSDYFPPIPVTPPVIDPNGLGPRGTQAIAVFWTDNTMTVCGPNLAGSGSGFDVSSARGGPVWVTVNLTALSGWPGGTVVSFVVEPDSPSIVGTGTATHGWLITTTHRMRVANIGLTPTLQYVGALSGSATANRRIEIGRGNPDYIGVGSYLKSGGGVVFDYSYDRGATWGVVSVPSVGGGHYDTASNNNWIPDVWFDPRNANRVITTAFTNTANFNAGLVADGFISTSLPPSFSALSNPDVQPGGGTALTIASAYQSGILAHTRIVHSGGTSVGTVRRVNGTTATDVSPVVGSTTYGTFIFPRAVSLADNDRNFCVVVGLSEYDGTGNVIVAYTRNFEGACDWTVVYGPVTYTAALWNGVYAISPTAVYMLGSNALGFLDINEGAVDNRIGNLSKSGVRAVGLCGISG